MTPHRQAPAETLGQRIARARLTLGAERGRAFTQTELARVLGVTPPTVSQWESGASEPGLATIVRLAAVLHVDPGQLAFGGAPDIAQRPTHHAGVRRVDGDEVRERQQAKRNAAKKAVAGDQPRPARPSKPR